MSNERKVRWDILALFVGAASLFVWIALLSHQPADPVGSLAWPFSLLYEPDTVEFPQNERIQNWCGYWGALISHLLLHGIGVGAYLVAILVSLSVVVMLRQKPWASPLSRSVGWTLVLVALTALPSLLGLKFQIPVAVGNGGYLGALISMLLSDHLAFAGGVIVIGSLFVAGVLLSTEYAALRFLKILLLGPTTSMVRRAARPSTNDSSLSGELDEQHDEEESELPFETFGPKVTFRKKDAKRDPAVEGSEAAKSEVPTQAGSGLEVAATLAGKTLQATAKGAGAVGTMAKTVLKKSLLQGIGNSKTTQEPATDDLHSDAEQLPSTSITRELEIDGERVQAREDQAHSVASKSGANGTTPNIKKRGEPKNSKDELDFIDDTRLPEGTEEYVLPGLDLLAEPEDVDFESQSIEVRRKAKVLEQTFADFGFNVKVVEIETGPVIAQYEIELEAGLRLSKITSLAEDIAIALRVPGVRIVAPIPGKNTVGIEVPNETRQVVRMREVIEEEGESIKKMKIPLFLGKDVSGNALSVDLATLPHLLIAGRTGTGKSVCLNTIISSMLMTRRPDEVRLLMIDPKMVELSGYGQLPHLMHPVVTDMRKAEAILAWAVDKMEERYQLLASVGVRHITSYNQLGREELLNRLQPESTEQASAIPDYLPFIVIVADEIADMMMTAGKDVEQHIIRLAQKSRAVGIHLILATQKPTVDVITGLIKSNLPARISFQVATRTDSRVVLDEMGADKLLGNGDMLFLWPGTSTLLRGQGTYMSDDEINRLVDHCSTGEQNFVNELVNLEVKSDESETTAKPGALKKRDELYESAIEVVIREGRGSCSLLQRALGIGYGRAARMIDWMAEDGIVGDYNGPQAREVVISQSDWDAMREGGESNAPPEPADRKNRIRMTEPAMGGAAVAVPAGMEEEEEEEETEEEGDVEYSASEESRLAVDDDAGLEEDLEDEDELDDGADLDADGDTEEDYEEVDYGDDEYEDVEED